ncbi:MAG: hypothetical protein PVH91_07835, partial [Pseudomonadales bacterium]
MAPPVSAAVPVVSMTAAMLSLEQRIVRYSGGSVRSGFERSVEPFFRQRPVDAGDIRQLTTIV